MKKIFYLFLPLMALSACSTDAIDSENFDSLDAKAVKQSDVTTEDIDVRSEWIYNNGNIDQGKAVVSNDCDSVTLQFFELDGEALTEVEFDLTTSLPSLNNGNQLSGPLPYNFGDLDENLSFTISFAELGITDEDNLYVFAKAWGKWAGASEHGKLSYFTYNVEAVACEVCTYGKGWWRNHSNDNPGEQANMWPSPFADFYLGNNTYTQSDLNNILDIPNNEGNHLVILAQHLIAAKLNVWNGAGNSDIITTISAADALIGDLAVGQDSFAADQKDAVNFIKDALEAFNESRPCDEDENSVE